MAQGYPAHPSAPLPTIRTGHSGCPTLRFMIIDGARSLDGIRDDEALSIALRGVGDHVHRLSEEIALLGESLDALLNADLAAVTVRQNQMVQKVSGWAALLAWF
jgi:Mg2+ and Co2+ transporter CorA